MFKKLKFTPENLERHINAYPFTPTADGARYIYTTRDEAKGNVGDIFDTSIGKFVLISCEKADYEGWNEEGFTSPEEFRDELRKIYGAESFPFGYIHILLKLNQEVEVC